MMEPQKLRILAIKDKGEYCVIFTGLEMAHQDSALLRLQHKLWKSNIDRFTQQLRHVPNH